MADNLGLPLTRALSHQLLESPVPFFVKDDQWHPKNRFTLSPRDPGHSMNDGPFLRCFDQYSGSQPDEYDDLRMLARKPRMRLDSREQRRITLQNHVNHKNRTWTPYISFTNSPDNLYELAEQRRTGAKGKERPDQKVIVVDPVRRFELGLPMVNTADTLALYDLLEHERDYHEEHYLCLWEVTPEEVVGIWHWDELRGNERWYEDIILPAVREFRARRSEDVSDSDEVIKTEQDSDYSGETEEEEYSDHYYVSSDDDETRCANNWAEQSWKEYEDNRS